MLEFTGDFRALQIFTEKVAAAPETLRLVNEQLAEETLDLIKECFERSEDPYGEPWPPLVLREGRPLQDTGGLKASWTRRFASVSGFGVEARKDYAIYHQQGTGIYGPKGQRIRPKTAKALKLPGIGFRASVKGTPPRRMVPHSARLPPKWRARYVETAHEVLSEHFR